MSYVAEGTRAVNRRPLIVTFSFTCSTTAALMIVVLYFINYTSVSLSSDS